MRLLFDQNISFRVVKQLKSIFPDAIGVRECGLFNADDMTIWEFARQNDYTVVTFDKDLPSIGSVKGFPPRIIWLRTGNLSNESLISLFTTRADQFSAFVNNDKNGCLLVYIDTASDNLTP